MSAAGDQDDVGGRRAGDDITSWPLIDHRLTALEKRVDRGFSEIDHKLDTLAFVRADVYAAEQVALEQRLKAMDAEIVEAARPGKWAMALLGSTFLVIVVGIIVQVALDLSLQ